LDVAKDGDTAKPLNGIEKIATHEKEIGEDGVKTQRADIYCKFIGCVNIRCAKADHAEIIKAEQGQADNQTA